MGIVDINDIAAIGAVRDRSSYELPPEAWTTALNMRAVDDGMNSLLGWEGIFGTPTVAPHFLFPIRTAAATYWIYTSLTKAYDFDGTTHNNITRLSGDYAANGGQDWNSTILGGIPILNNGVNLPQYWATPGLGRLADLPNWDANARAKIIRAFGPFLVAFNLTDSGTNKPHLVRWSHPADPGSVPSSWDVTDPTKDTGQSDLPDVQAGLIQDALPLSSIMYIYKEGSTYKMRFIGGRDIMDFGQTPWLTTSGILTARCVCVTGDGLRHVVATQDDIIWHDGNQVVSILDQRQRRRLLNDIDATHFDTSFIFDNFAYKEVWFCYPSSGASFPDKALIMNYSDSKAWVITEADGITFRHAIAGRVESSSEETWADNPTEQWDTDTGPWSTLLRRRVLLAGTGSTKIFNLDRTQTRDGTSFSTQLAREGLSILGQDRKGAWIVDHQLEKMIARLWPKIQGGPINIRVGAATTVNGAVTWGASSSFDPSVTLTADIEPVTGRANAVEFSGPSGTSWRMDGYKLDIQPVGDAGVIQS